MASLMFYTLVLLRRMLVLRTRTGLYLVMHICLQNDLLQRLDIKLYFCFLIRYNNFIYTRYFHQSFPFFQHQALGNSPTNSVVIPQSLMFAFCFHQWKYFFLYPWRFLVFFDDGFAQYLPVKKLHHVYHTGIKCLRV